VKIAIIVQEMVKSTKSGILFTADPLTENRNIISIDAGFGLGEALVSGIVSADNFRVDKKTWAIISRKIAQKKIVIHPTGGGESGVNTTSLSAEMQETPTLSDPEILALARIGHQVEHHFNSPQDIEWAIADNHIFITQSRPITTLYPLPRPLDGLPHLYISFNYVQVMMDPIHPLGISVIGMLLIGDKTSRSDESIIAIPAGGRMFIEITPLITFKRIREKIPQMFSFVVDPLFGKAVQKGIEKLTPYVNLIPSSRRLALKVLRKIDPFFRSKCHKLY
jgi:hypothetical protein